MSIKPNVHSFQDMPPSGGYPKINTRKDLRPRGPTGFMIWGGVILSSIIGFWSLSKTSTKHRMGKNENRDARMAIYPFLKAEDDRKLLELIRAARASA